MWKQEEDEYNDFIDYQRRAKEDIKTRRFCPNCMQVVKMKLREYKHFQNHLLFIELPFQHLYRVEAIEEGENNR